MTTCNDMAITTLTHLGLVREVNEDRHYVKCLNDRALLMAVVDGMGGGPAGSAAAETVRQALHEFPEDTPHPCQTLTALIISASEAILETAEKNPALEGMGATVTATYLSEGMAHWAHVGDTRFYVLRAERLIQVTVDQNMAQLLVEEGRISRDEARVHPYNHLLDQCVGCPMCTPETGRFPIEDGDLLLHTTDGLHDAFSDDELLKLLASPDGSIEDRAESLIQAALKAGGKDNMTLVIAAHSTQRPSK
jgi:protein phosphatase